MYRRSEGRQMDFSNLFFEYFLFPGVLKLNLFFVLPKQYRYLDIQHIKRQEQKMFYRKSVETMNEMKLELVQMMGD